MNTPFWEESYKDDNIYAFGKEPNNSIIEFMNLLDKSWDVLDVGCGDGKNALYLAQLGFKVDAFDLSENAISKLKRIAKSEQIYINAWVGDLCKFSFTKPYDLIFSFGTLHFIEKCYWRNFIINAKENTNIGGVHIIQLFTNKLPASPDIAPFAVGLADENEIQELYNDWHIHQFKSYVFEDEHPGIPKHFHASNKIIAQKIL